MDFEFSKALSRISPSPIRAMFEGVKNKKDMIDLSLGQPDFCEPEILKITSRFLNRGADLFSYADIGGLPELRQAVPKFYKAKSENIIMTIGASGALFLACGALLERGDEVIIFEPYFVAYPNLANFFGAKIKYVKSDANFQPDLKDFKNKISSKTKIIFINSPNNPTGAVYDREVIDEIIKYARRYDAWIVSDEIYSVFEPGFESLWGKYERLCVVSGFAKSLGIPGWRLGYLLAPADLIINIMRLQQLTYVCAPKFAQEVVLEFIKKKKVLRSQKIVSEFQKRQKFIKNILGDAFQVGAFYSFLKTREGGAIVAQKLLAQGVMTVPGIAFANSKQYHNFIRIAHNADKEKLKIALEKIKSHL